MFNKRDIRPRVIVKSRQLRLHPNINQILPRLLIMKTFPNRLKYL